MDALYANICVDISHEKVDRPFQYKIPTELRTQVEPGVQVEIPFGRGNKVIKGFVLEVTDKAAYDEDKTKEILSVVKEGISAEGRSVALANWIRHQYGSTLIAALKTVLPVKEKVKQLEKRDVFLKLDENGRIEALREAVCKHHVGKERLFEAFEDVESLSYEVVTGQLHVSPQTIKSMERQGVIAIETRTTYRNPVKVKQMESVRHVLSDSQQQIVNQFVKDYLYDVRKTYLLHGVTGSGKTEVYMEMIDAVLSQGKQAIVLIPEIALTYQTVLRFYKRFSDKVSVIHSKLSKGERYDQFERARNGEIQIMIGPRSALFTPFEHLGLIIIDEEHEASYKSDSMPKLHARETAEYIAATQHASVVLGSATPSMTSYYRAKQGQYELMTLESRFGESQLPSVDIVDLRDELAKGNRSMFSRLLMEKMQDRLEKGQQMMLFLNRRGFAGFVSCRKCGYVARCPHCDVSLTQHRDGKLRCHYCGYETQHMTSCPECGSKYIAGFKVGTQQVEDSIKKLFPNARVLRMDKDTTSKKDDYENILSSFAAGEADVLVGTQMIVKGHDFPNVTLVGVIAADLSLGSNDYAAAERTFQLLTQAVGRAGRGAHKGEAIIQTYQPEHYAITYAATQDYTGFYQEEIGYRALCDYPPAKHMLAVLLTSPREDLAAWASDQMAAVLKSKTGALDVPWQVIGPADATVSRINDQYRKMIYIRHADYQALVMAKDVLEALMEENKQAYSRVNIYFDFDPMSGY